MKNNNKANSGQPLSVDFEAVTSLFAEAAADQRTELSSDELSQLLTVLGAEPLTRIVNRPATAPGSALFVEIRNTREFGMVISAGVGGDSLEICEDSFGPGQASVSAATALVDAEAFFELFRRSFCYKQLSGQAGSGQKALVSDQQLLSCFGTFIELANYFSPTSREAPRVIERLVINPFLFMDELMLPLDGVCRFSEPKAVPASRPIARIDRLLHPRSIGIIGVSASKMNFGRIILKNLLGSGYDPQQMTIIRPGETEIDGVRCAESLQQLDHKLDLFIVAVGAEAVFDLVDEIIAEDAAESVMLVPGGLGETEASREPAAAMARRINDAHRREQGGPVFLGGNCLGVVSHPGGYDSWFIPLERLPKPQKKQQRHCALISQSGAFMVTRLGRNPWLDPAYMTALGNQTDISHGDMLRYYVDNDRIDTIGVYIEGFTELDGLAFAAAVREAVLKGKQVVVYKAGRTEPGQASALGHTASVAGDYGLCKTVLEQAGAIVARDFSEFDDLFYMASCLHDKRIGGNRVAGVSGAGFETVGMADSIGAENSSLQVSAVGEETARELTQILAAKRLDALMEVRNPMDINPGADDEAHLLCTRAFIDADNVDAVVVGLDPASPMMRALEQCSRPGFDINSEESIVQTLPELVASRDKPIIGIVDGGPLYDPMVEKLKDAGVCIYRSCERGTRALARYTEARLRGEQLRQQR